MGGLRSDGYQRVVFSHSSGVLGPRWAHPKYKLSTLNAGVKVLSAD